MSELRLIDADGHVCEDVNEINQYLEPPFAGRRFFFPLWPADGRFRGMRIDAATPTLWRDFMDAVGIATAVVYPTFGLSHGLIRDRDWACALARAYNNWLHDHYLKVDSRFKGVALLPLQDVHEAARELRRAVKELGMVAGLMTAVTYNRKAFGSLDYHPLFREAEALGCPLAIHGSPQTGLGLEVFERHVEAHVLTHPLPVSIHFISMIFGGVFETFPKLRVVFLEAGCGWIPFLMERMDYEMERLQSSFKARPSTAPPIRKLPSEYAKGCNVYVSCEANEKSIPWAAQFFGEDTIVFPTDFPHTLTFEVFVEEVKEFISRKDISPDLSRKILWDNPKRLYGI